MADAISTGAFVFRFSLLCQRFVLILSTEDGKEERRESGVKEFEGSIVFNAGVKLSVCVISYVCIALF